MKKKKQTKLKPKALGKGLATKAATKVKKRESATIAALRKMGAL